MFCAIPAFSQEASAQSQTLSELQQEENSRFADMFSQENTTQNQKSKEPSTFWLFFRTILVLVLVVAAIYAVFHFVKKQTNPTGNETDPFLKKVASLNLQAGKSVHIVTLDNHCYVLGVADDSVSLISELDYEKDKDLIDAMNLHESTEPTGKKRDFASMLASVMGTKKKSNDEVLKSAMSKLKMQTSRLKKDEVSSKEDENENANEE